mgnify:CR=1 FL=1
MSFDPEAEAAKAGRGLSRLNETMLRINYDPPPVSLRNAVIGVLALGVAAFLLHWWVVDARDQWWRDKIASSTAVTRSILRQGATVATATDEQIIKGLQDAEQKRIAAERQLADFRTNKSDDSRNRCVVPVDCLRE